MKNNNQNLSLNNNNNLENISSFDSNEFCKMDLKNSFELENKNFSPQLRNLVPNKNFDENLNLENIENDFLIKNEFNNVDNNFDNIDNLVIDFNTNIHLHNDNINSIDLIDKNQMTRKFAEKAKKEEKRKSRKKIDLDKTPLPIFACIYCSNENVVFNHMSNEIISEKYLYNCSWFDLKNINLIVSTYFVYNLNSINLEIKSLVNLIVNYSEYLDKYNSIKNSQDYIKKFAEENKETYTPLLKYRFFCTENTMMTFFFKNTSILF